MTTVMLPLGHVSWPDRDALRGDRRPVCGGRIPTACGSPAMTQRFPTPNPILVDLRPRRQRRARRCDTDETEVTVEPLNDPARDRLDQVVVALDGDRLRVEVPRTASRSAGRPSTT